MSFNLMYVGGGVNDQIQLTTFKKLEESIVEEHGVVKEPNKGNDDDDEEKKSITEEDGVAIVAESS